MLRHYFTSAVSGWQPWWNTQVSARFHAADKRFTDEDILTILRAGEAGVKVADLCAATDIPVQTYYVWKVKYSGLTPSELRRRRRREGSRTAVALTALAVAVLGAGYALIATRSAAPAQQATANAPQNPTQPTAAPVVNTSSPPFKPSLQAVAPAEDALPGTSVERLVGVNASGTWVDAEGSELAEPDGYSVQVAAVPDLQEARVVLEQLVGAGYSAYLTRTIVDQVELYRVRVGPLKSHPMAEEVARRLERGGYRAPWVTK